MEEVSFRSDMTVEVIKHAASDAERNGRVCP